jgi:hypothetical protein
VFRAQRGQRSPRYSVLFCGFALILILIFVSRLGKTDELDHFVVRVGKTVKITASYNYCWFPTVHQFSTGEILTTMRTSPDETNPEGEFSAYCISRDGGKTWSRRYPMGAGANIDEAYSQVPLDGGIWALGAGYASLEPFPPNQKTDFHVTLTKFSQGGMDVHQIRDARIHLSEPAEFEPVELYAIKTQDASQLGTVPSPQPCGAIIGGPGGEWLTTLSYTTEGNQSRLVLLRSFDHGHTWNEDAVIAAEQPQKKPPWMGDGGPGEAGLVRLSENRLYSIFRTGEYMGETWSFDDGKTWSPPVSTGLKGVAPHLRLMSNGLLVCTFGRPGPVTIMFSQNEGKKWAAITPIFKGRSSCYTDVIELETGKLFVVFDSLPGVGGNTVPETGTFTEHSIYGIFVEVQKR